MNKIHGKCFELINVPFVSSYKRKLTEYGDGAQKDVDNAEEVVPHGVDWREGVPMRMDHMFDVVRH